jgi:hypothetical protein
MKKEYTKLHERHVKEKFKFFFFFNFVPKIVIVIFLGIRTSSKPTWTTWREVRCVNIRVCPSFYLFKFEFLCESDFISAV